MNLPNKLSIVRVLCVPLIVFFMMMPDRTFQWIALVLFLLASLTDYLDGHIARKQGLITDFGRFIDPIADKLLVLSTMIMQVYQGFLPPWAVVIILARELSVDGLRLIAVTNNTVIAASKLGKIKTVSQMLLIIWIMVFQQSVFTHWSGLILFLFAVFMTLLSGVDYFRKTRHSFILPDLFFCE